MTLRKAGSNWVEGDRFFDREVELEALDERVRDGVHTLLTAQRRMGKTSLVRELLRRLAEAGEAETLFVDLESASTAADAVVEIVLQVREKQDAWAKIKGTFANVLREASERVEELSLADAKIRLRAGTDAGNWRQRGDDVLASLATGERPVVLALDELPILVNRLLKGDAGQAITAAGRRAADEFLTWLRKSGQTHRGRLVLILSGSVGLEPLLEQARLSTHANIFSPYDLKPWTEATAAACLAELATSYEVSLPLEARRAMCRRLRCCIPHHVQMFFDKLHEELRREGRRDADVEDVDRVYREEMLAVRGQVDLQHYQDRLAMVLGTNGYLIALDVLTAAAVGGGSVGPDQIRDYRAYCSSVDADGPTGLPSFDDILHVLTHDGYLERRNGEYRFVSGLLEDWWRSRYGEHFRSVTERLPRDGGIKR